MSDCINRIISSLLIIDKTLLDIHYIYIHVQYQLLSVLLLLTGLDAQMAIVDLTEGLHNVRLGTVVVNRAIRLMRVNWILIAGTSCLRREARVY